MAAKKKQYVLARRYTVLGDYLQKMRLEANLTQREVSQALGYSSAQFISNFERGIAVPPLKKLKILVKMYGMAVDTVMEMILNAERDIMISALKGKGAKAS
ncbi:MAG: helix-turn-helix domain-containing protein [Proteobacteria bacterium]|nr:MAG: helix-turn-helix domain-containing protein [Pseudomonadota bacterium]